MLHSLSNLRSKSSSDDVKSKSRLMSANVEAAPLALSVDIIGYESIRCEDENMITFALILLM